MRLSGSIPLAVGAMLAALAGAVTPGAGAQTPARTGGMLTVTLTGVDSLDPAIGYSFGANMVNAALQRAPLRYAPDHPEGPVPDLATALPEVSPDGRTVTVHLRSGVRFSPPVDREATSRDVKYAIERGFFRTVRSPYAPIYFGELVGARPDVAPGTSIAGLETPDDHTLVMRLARPSGGLVANALVMTLAAPVPPEVAGPPDAHQPTTYVTRLATTGPYMPRALSSRRLHAVRNPNWDRATDTRPAPADALEIALRDGNSAASNRRILTGSGRINGDSFPPPAVLRQALARRRDQVAFAPGGLLSFVSLNTRAAPFDRLDVRRAVVAGFDRRGMLATAGGALADPVATHYIPPGVPGFAEAGGNAGPSSDLYARPGGDLRLAARYLRRAGFRSGRYTGSRTISMLGVSGDPAAGSGARFVKRQFERLGFRVSLRFAAFSTMTARCGAPRSSIDVCPIGGWVRDFADPQTIIDPLFDGASIAAGTNWSHLDVPALNAGMARATVISDPAARASAWARLDRRLTALAPAIAVGWPRAVMLRSRDVAGVVNRGLATWDLSSTGLRG
jgi:peptide/nickel transport system substrate-binding protein